MRIQQLCCARDLQAMKRAGTSQVQRADWVTTRASEGQPRRPLGFVKRCARDGSWADVRWKSGEVEWSKRMRCAALVVLAELCVPVHADTPSDDTEGRA